MKTIIEPFKIKSVEPIRFTTKEERIVTVRNAHYNPFLISADDVMIDLLTDSGTSAMSSAQWAGIVNGDESYAGSRSFFRFEKSVQKITGMPIVIPTHQGRAAEKILFTVIGGKGKFVVSNTLFDTTRANIEFSEAVGIDFPCEESNDTATEFPFKGNIDLQALELFLAQHGASAVSMCIMTITNNSCGGQPVSMANIRDAHAICKRHGVLFYIDACRFAENAYFIKQREKGYADKSILEIVNEIFSYGDGCTMSAKKDAFANIGGFLALRDETLATQFRNLLILTEGFTTYGGLAGRDLEAIAIGLEEVIDENYLHYRIRSSEYLCQILDRAGVPVMKPAGGHAIYLDAGRMLPHISAEQYPGQALCCELFVEGGIRSVEIGSLMFGKYDANGKLIPSRMELVRLAIPRRVYTQSHIDYVAEVVIAVWEKRESIKGLRIVKEADVLRHFTAELELL